MSLNQTLNIHNLTYSILFIIKPSDFQVMFYLTAQHITRRLSSGAASAWNCSNIWRRSGPATRHRWHQCMVKYSQSFSQTAYWPAHCDYQSVANGYKMLTACLMYIHDSMIHERLHNGNCRNTIINLLVISIKLNRIDGSKYRSINV